MAAIPTWKDIISHQDFQNADLGTKYAVREKWLKDIRKRDKLDKETFKQLRSNISVEELPPETTQQVIAKTPQVEENPQPFDTTLEQMVGMPPGTAIIPSQSSAQMPKQAEDNRPLIERAGEKASLYGEAATTGIKRAPLAAGLYAGKAGQVTGRAMKAGEGAIDLTTPPTSPFEALGMAFGAAIPKVAQDVINISTNLEEAAGDELKNRLKISDRVQNDFVARGIANGFEMLGPSALAIIPSVITGNPLPAMALSGALFGLSAFKDTEQQLIDAGVPSEEAFARALINGISQGGIESFSTAIELATAGLSKPAIRLVRQIAGKGTKSLLAKMAKIYGIEYAEEVAQGATEKFLKDKYKNNPKVPNIPWKDLFKETLIPVAISTLALSGTGQLTQSIVQKAEKAQADIDAQDIIVDEETLPLRKPAKRPLTELKKAEAELEEEIVRKGKGFKIVRQEPSASKKSITIDTATAADRALPIKETLPLKKPAKRPLEKLKKEEAKLAEEEVIETEQTKTQQKAQKIIKELNGSNIKFKDDTITFTRKGKDFTVPAEGLTYKRVLKEVGEPLVPPVSQEVSDIMEQTRQDMAAREIEQLREEKQKEAITYEKISEKGIPTYKQFLSSPTVSDKSKTAARKLQSFDNPSVMAQELFDVVVNGKVTTNKDIKQLANYLTKNTDKIKAHNNVIELASVITGKDLRKGIRKPTQIIPPVKKLTQKEAVNLATEATNTFKMPFQHARTEGGVATFNIKGEESFEFNVPVETLQQQGSKSIINAFKDTTKKVSQEERTRANKISKQKTSDLVKGAGKAFVDMMGGPEKGTFSTKQRTAKQRQAELELRLISKELYRRFKRGGKKRFTNFMDYLTKVHKIDEDRASLINAQAEKDIVKTKKTKKQKQMPPELIARLNDAGDSASKVEMMYNDAEAEAQRIAKSKKSVNKTYEKLKRGLVDVSGNLKNKLLQEGGKQGREVVIDHDLTRGAHAKAGRMINEARKKIYKNLSKDEERVLNRIITSRRVITIEGYKPETDQPYDLTAEDHKKYLNTLPKELRNELNNRADEYFKVMEEQLTAMRYAGLISKKSYQALKSKGDYSPRNFLKYIDPDSRTAFRSGKKITVSESGIQALEEGDFGLLDIDSRRLLSQVITRTQSRIMRNNANGSLYSFAKDNPNNNIVKVFKGDKVPPKWERINVMINGNKRSMIMPKELANEWVETDPSIDAAVANWAGILSGNKLLKAMATSLNPEFALTNLPRDLAHIFLTTEEYSSNLFIAPLQMAADLAAVKNDAIFRKGAYVDYINEGGGMETLTKQGRFSGKATDVLDIGQVKTIEQLEEYLGYIGETSEIWTRLALRHRAIKNDASPKEATWIARNYLDFAQGGNIAKAADTVIPYLNASIQGTRGIVRAAKNNPWLFTWKASQIGVLAAGLYLVNSLMNKDALDQIRPRDKVNNWIITTPFSYTDKNGDKRYLYFKIAKDQGQRVFGTLFESLMAKFMGEKVDGTQIAQSIWDFLPIVPTNLMPPTMDAMLGYASNRDFWAQEDIWKGPTVSPELEFTPYTHPAFVGLGKATGLSPERSKYALQQFFTYGNIYTSLGGWISSPLFSQLNPKQREEATVDLLRQKPFLRRIMKATDPYTKYEKTVEKEKLQENDRRYLQKMKLDELSEKWLDSRSTEDRQKLLRFVNDQDPIDKKRLRQRIKYNKSVHHLKDRKWWRTLESSTPEVRARIYWSRYRVASPAEKERLDKQLRKLPGLKSKRFTRELRRLKKGEKEVMLLERP